ncbi:IS110 family transposase [Anaerovoracaceae bacterium SGI.174]
MLSVGIDVSKEKSTVCAMRPFGEIVVMPFEINHTDSALSELMRMIKRLDTDSKVVMEATGIYHLPVASFLRENGLFVSVINPYEMKLYRAQDLRKVKTDKRDSMTIANYGIDKWFDLREFTPQEDVYAELRLLGRQYRFFMESRIDHLLNLTHLLDYTMPGVKACFGGWSESSGKDKLCDFVEEYWHYDNITRRSEKKFVEHYQKWTKKKGYQFSETKALQIYSLAKDGIPTIPSNAPSTKMLLLEATRALREVNSALFAILTRMKELAKTLPEYPVVRAMGGVGDVLAVKLIAEIGDVRKFKSGKALIAYAGIDPPPYESGKFIGTERHISKRGSTTLRKIGYEVMRCVKSNGGNRDTAVYDFMLKKEDEGKAKKVAKIAALNKFLRIYYARVMEVYS